MDILPIVIMLVVAIGMPLGYAIRVWRLDENSRAAWLIAVADAAMVVTLVVLFVRWDMAGHYTRFVLIALFAAALVRSWARHAGRPWVLEGAASSRRLPSYISLALLTAALVYTISGLLPSRQVQALEFPLEGGAFMVGQGGGNWLFNHHSDHRAQRYAADIVAIGPAGFRADGLLPEELDRYAVFDAAVVSPCAGTVTDAVDGLPDLVPPQRDRDNPAGNHVIIDCANVTVEIAHLRQDSVAVQAGQALEVGDPVGRVGNSGNTTEPHLHIHAVDANGDGVEMAFEGRRPLRNRVFWR